MSGAAQAPNIPQLAAQCAIQRAKRAALRGALHQHAGAIFIPRLVQKVPESRSTLMHGRSGRDLKATPRVCEPRRGSKQA
jgi:hypothetical protein